MGPEFFKAYSVFVKLLYTQRLLFIITL